MTETTQALSELARLREENRVLKGIRKVGRRLYRVVLPPDCGIPYGEDNGEPNSFRRSEALAIANDARLAYSHLFERGTRFYIEPTGEVEWLS